MERYCIVNVFSFWVFARIHEICHQISNWGNKPRIHLNFDASAPWVARIIECACPNSVRKFSAVARVGMDPLSVRITSLTSTPATAMHMGSCGDGPCGKLPYRPYHVNTRNPRKLKIATHPQSRRLEKTKNNVYQNDWSIEPELSTFSSEDDSRMPNAELNRLRKESIQASNRTLCSTTN